MLAEDKSALDAVTPEVVTLLHAANLRLLPTRMRIQPEIAAAAGALRETSMSDTPLVAPPSEFSFLLSKATRDILFAHDAMAALPPSALGAHTIKHGRVDAASFEKALGLPAGSLLPSESMFRFGSMKPAAYQAPDLGTDIDAADIDAAANRRRILEAAARAAGTAPHRHSHNSSIVYGPIPSAPVEEGTAEPAEGEVNSAGKSQLELLAERRMSHISAAQFSGPHTDRSTANPRRTSSAGAALLSMESLQGEHSALLTKELSPLYEDIGLNFADGRVSPQRQQQQREASASADQASDGESAALREFEYRFNVLSRTASVVQNDSRPGLEQADMEDNMDGESAYTRPTLSTSASVAAARNKAATKTKTKPPFVLPGRPLPKTVASSAPTRGGASAVDNGSLADVATAADGASLRFIRTAGGVFMSPRSASTGRAARSPTSAATPSAAGGTRSPKYIEAMNAYVYKFGENAIASKMSAGAASAVASATGLHGPQVSSSDRIAVASAVFAAEAEQRARLALEEEERAAAQAKAEAEAEAAAVAAKALADAEEAARARAHAEKVARAEEAAQMEAEAAVAVLDADILAHLAYLGLHLRVETAMSTSLSVEVNRLTRASHALLMDNGSLFDALTTGTRIVDEQRSKIEALREEMNGLTNSLVAERGTNRSLLDRLAATEGDKVTVEGDLQAANIAIEDLKADLEGFRDRNMRLHKEVERAVAIRGQLAVALHALASVEASKMPMGVVASSTEGKSAEESAPSVFTAAPLKYNEVAPFDATAPKDAGAKATKIAQMAGSLQSQTQQDSRLPPTSLDLHDALTQLFPLVVDRQRLSIQPSLFSPAAIAGGAASGTDTALLAGAELAETMDEARSLLHKAKRMANAASEESRGEAARALNAAIISSPTSLTQGTDSQRGPIDTEAHLNRSANAAAGRSVPNPQVALASFAESSKRHMPQSLATEAAEAASLAAAEASKRSSAAAEVTSDLLAQVSVSTSTSVSEVIIPSVAAAFVARYSTLLSLLGGVNLHHKVDGTAEGKAEDHRLSAATAARTAVAFLESLVSSASVAPNVTATDKLAVIKCASDAIQMLSDGLDALAHSKQHLDTKRFINGSDKAAAAVYSSKQEIDELRDAFMAADKRHTRVLAEATAAMETMARQKVTAEQAASELKTQAAELQETRALLRRAELVLQKTMPRLDNLGTAWDIVNTSTAELHRTYTQLRSQYAADKAGWTDGVADLTLAAQRVIEASARAQTRLIGTASHMASTTATAGPTMPSSPMQHGPAVGPPPAPSAGFSTPAARPGPPRPAGGSGSPMPPPPAPRGPPAPSATPAPAAGSITAIAAAAAAAAAARMGSPRPPAPSSPPSTPAPAGPRPPAPSPPPSAPAPGGPRPPTPGPPGPRPAAPLPTTLPNLSEPEGSPVVITPSAKEEMKADSPIGPNGSNDKTTILEAEPTSKDTAPVSGLPADAQPPAIPHQQPRAPKPHSFEAVSVTLNAAADSLEGGPMSPSSHIMRAASKMRERIAIASVLQDSQSFSASLTARGVDLLALRDHTTEEPSSAESNMREETRISASPESIGYSRSPARTIPTRPAPQYSSPPSIPPPLPDSMSAILRSMRTVGASGALAEAEAAYERRRSSSPMSIFTARAMREASAASTLLNSSFSASGSVTTRAGSPLSRSSSAAATLLQLRLAEGKY
jgi:hypothetical protein